MARSYAITTPASSFTPSTTVAFAAIYCVGGTVRSRLYEIITASSASLNDYSSRWQVSRLTTAPSNGTGQTPAPLDSQDPASINTGMIATITGNGSLGTTLMAWAVNLRATFRWVAAPTKELVGQASANCGLALMLMAQQGANHAVDTTMFYEE